MFANWKSAVYEYAHRRNQLEIEGDSGQLAPFVLDDRFIRRLEQRIRRQQASRTSRRILSLRSETGMRIRSIDETDRQAVIEVELRRSIDYEQRSRSFREDRLETEVITLSKQGSRWLIAAIEPAITERRYPHAATPPFVPTESERTDRAAIRSLPYLNQRVLQANAPEPVNRNAYYDRAKARQYAETWWNSANPQYSHFEVDCTNFVSQCLVAGGAPMNYTGRRESGWWYQGRVDNRELWSYSWAVAHSLQAYLASSRGGLRAETADSPMRLAIGDVICYDWDGDGRYQHNTIVTGFDAAGMPLVNAHTTESRMRYWDYRDSYAWTPNTRYRFFHIADYF